MTGGTSGLGYAMASALRASGTTVALTGRSRERAVSVAAGLTVAIGMEPDVRDARSVVRVVDEAWTRRGGFAPNDASSAAAKVDQSSPS